MKRERRQGKRRQSTMMNEEQRQVSVQQLQRYCDVKKPMHLHLSPPPISHHPSTQYVNKKTERNNAYRIFLNVHGGRGVI